jgi:HSP20 family molecular chaperone IbpA
MPLARAVESFQSLDWPISVADRRCDAKYENGVLKLELKKKAEAQPKQIKVT